MNEFNQNENFEDVELSKDSFELVQSNTKIFDQKFETKATTYFKDALKRFRKNKSSVVGAFILGLLILLAIIVPIVSPFEINSPRVQERFLEPKLFEAGTGFWDGTRKYTNIIYDVDKQQPADYYAPAVTKLVVDKEPSYIDVATKYGKGGYFVFRNEVSNSTASDLSAVKYLSSYPTKMTATGGYQVVIELVDIADVKSSQLGEYRILLEYGDNEFILLKDYSREYKTLTLNLSDAIHKAGLTEIEGAKLRFELKAGDGIETYILIKSCVFTSNDNNKNLEIISINDATQSVLYAKDANGVAPVGYWVSDGVKNIYQAQVYYCSFVYDTYAAVYDKYEKTIAYSTLQDYIKAGWCKYDSKVGPESFEVLSDKCPIDGIKSQTTNVIGKVTEVTAEVYRYREYGYTSMPKFLFGTDESGHDIVKEAFSGLRTSLILGVCTCAFCLLFGLCWGAISGYFGGNIDLAMERFCEILSGVPWIVIMTLCILHLGNNFFTFFLALCMTGWMGTAARTRTQFYRFKGREYILASRTLGASDMRLIFRHILPNALGTIVTGSVLMIPSVIFSEATLAYLNLGLQGVNSFGVMLSNNQGYISTYPNLIVFPACIIALMMISFNLFGNGLRDALNPSLKGSE